MTAAELARKVRLVELRARRTSGGVISGAWHSAFKGRGVEFHEVREYVPGDEVRSIDWNVTARVGRPFVKRFAEERDQTVMLVVDGSRSQFAPQGRVLKAETVSEICAVLAFAAVRNRDAVGLILFTDRVELYVPPGRGGAHVLRIVREVLAFRPQSAGTSIAGALEFLSRVQRRRSLVFLISDFQDRGFERALKIAGRRHEVIGFPVFDAREEGLPDIGLALFEDAESGESFCIDSSDVAARTAWRRGEVLRTAGIDYLRVEAGSDYWQRLEVFLRRRGKKD